MQRNPPEAVLDQWSQWRVPGLSTRPHVVKPLSGGLTNSLWWLSGASAAGAVDMVLRIHHSRSNQLGIDRRREYRIHCAATAQGIAPRYYYLANDSSYSVIEWLDGNTWLEHGFATPAHRALVLASLQKMSAAELDLPAFDYHHYVRHFLAQLDSSQSGFNALRDRSEALLDRLSNSLEELQWGIVHHDLNPRNIIENRHGIWLIDWEYAAWGLVGLDHARLSPDLAPPLMAELNQLHDALWTRLVAQYEARSPRPDLVSDQ